MMLGRAFNEFDGFWMISSVPEKLGDVRSKSWSVVIGVGNRFFYTFAG